MIRYLTRRLLSAIPVVLGVSLVTTLVAHGAAGKAVPGLVANPTLTPSDIAQIRSNLGLDRPLYQQYLSWLWGLMHANFGRSLIDGLPVTTLIRHGLPNTLELTGTAMLLGLLLAIPFGVLAARKRGRPADHALTISSVIGFSIPQFWLGLMLIVVFAVIPSRHGWPALPTGGAYSAYLGGGFVDRLRHLILPASVLAFFYLCVWSRFIRSSMIEVLSQDFITTARAKGMRERRAVFVHALKNALIPLVTLLGVELPGLLSGALVVEVVFSWPGIGLLAYQRALQFDYTTILGITTFTALLVVIGNLLADVMYSILDPRVRRR